jgi:hypothetical protein
MNLHNARRLAASSLGVAMLVLLGACQREAAAPVATASAVPAAPAAPAASAASVSAAAVDVPAQMLLRADALLAAHRQMIVLMTGERSLKPADRRAVSAVGQLLFHDMLDRQKALIAQAGDVNDPAVVPALNALLDRVESEPSWFDADRLAFKEFLTELAARYGQSQSLAGLKLGRRAGEDLAVLAEVEQAYDRELKDVFGRFAQRGIELKREKWADYVAKLQGLYNREQILKDFGAIVPYTQPTGAAKALALTRAT